MGKDNLDIFNKLKIIILNIKPGVTEKISLDSDIVDDLGFSSFEIFVLVHDVEKEFDVKIAEQDIKNNFNLENMIKTITQNKLRKDGNA